MVARVPFEVRQRVLDSAKGHVSPRRRRDLKLALAGARAHVLPRLRPLPRALVIGAMRAGTTSLYRYLDSHPEAVPSLRKEVQYFTRYWHRDEAWYRCHFPMGASGLTYEATPDYLFVEPAAVRAHATVPDAQVIVLLRDPLARLVSHHGHMQRLGLEDLPLDAALEAEHQRLEPAQQALAHDELDLRPALLRYSYLARSRYTSQLQHWLRYYPAEQITLVWSEDLYADTERVLGDLATRLGISPDGFTGTARNYSRQEATSPPRERQLVPAWVRDELAEEKDRLAALVTARFPDSHLPAWLGGVGR